jgi:WD40 repeat protein/predicted Ser/Thr protein kinase
MSDDRREDRNISADAPLARVEAIVQEALDAAPSDRARIISERCGGDSKLLRAVQRLLDIPDATVDSFLNAPPASALAMPNSEAALSPRGIPSRIGRYEIIRRVGEGGMGVVYEARQDHPRRRVALKLIRAGLPSDAELRRFRREAEVLGQLQHAGIAHVYDAGLAEVVLPTGTLAGQPYIAMEFIEGTPITDYLKAQEAESRKVLELFVAVCEAVHHAHAKGIIHRDLKPGNIIVDAEGQPRILDFGIARLITTEGDPATLRTDVGQLIGTLPYMSPEQVAGDHRQLDTRSDVYALGVLLYELLTGRLPHDLRNRSLHDGIRIIREDEPTRLSSINTRFHGDLDTIAAKALEKSKERRYASAAALAEDIRHFLNFEPIVARPISTLYQLRKFARRNRTLVGGIAATFVALIAGLIGMAFFASKEHSQRIRADTKSLEARQLAYRASIAAAAADVQDGENLSALANLQNAPADQRGWEWSYYSFMANRAEHSCRLPHDSKIHHVVSSLDMRKLAIQYADGMLAVWNSHDAQALRQFAGPPGALNRVISMSPDGSRLAAITLNEGAGIFNIATGKREVALKDVSAIGDFSANGSTLLALHRSQPRLLVIDTITGDVIREFATPLNEMHDARLSPDGTLFAILWGSTIYITDALTGRLLYATNGWQWAFSRDSSRLYFFDAELKAIDSRSGKPADFPESKLPQGVLYWRPDGKAIANFDTNHQCNFREATTLKSLAELRSSSDLFYGGYSSDSRRFLMVSPDRQVSTWDADITDAPFKYELAGQDSCLASAISPAADLAASAEWGVVSLIDTATTSLRWRRAFTRQILDAVAFSADGKLVAAAGKSGALGVIDVATGDVIHSVSLDKANIIHLSFNPADGSVLAACENGAIYQVATANPESNGSPQRIEQRRAADGAAIQSMAYSADGKRLAYAAASEPARSVINIVDADNFAPIHAISIGATTAECLAFLDTGSIIAVGCRDQSVRYYNLNSGDPVATFAKAPAAVCAIAEHPDRSRLAAACEDGSIVLWNTSTQEKITTISSRTNSLQTISFTADGKALVAAGEESPLLIFETARPAEGYGVRHCAARGRCVATPMIEQKFMADEIIARLSADKALPEDTRAAAIEHVQRRSDNPNRLNSDAWGLAIPSASPIADYERGLKLSRRAVDLFPDDYGFQNTLGVLQYRCGRFDEALTTLQACAETGRRLNGSPHPCDLIFLAMTHHRLGADSDAAELMSQAEALMKLPQFATDNELLGFIKELRSAKIRRAGSGT